MQSVHREGLTLSVSVLACINYGGVLVQMFSSDSCPLLLLIEDTTGNTCRLKAIEDVFHKAT